VSTFDEVLLVGGSTRMPAVAAGLRDRFQLEPKLHDPDLAVAKGAARFALIEWVKVAMGKPPAEGEEAVGARAAEQVADQLGIPVRQVEQLAQKSITTVVPRAFGVKVYHRENPDADGDGFIVDHLLSANTALPASPPTAKYATAHDRQTSIRIEIWEQSGAVESARLTDNSKIGDGVIAELPHLPKGSPIEVDFQMDETGTLRVHAVELRTGRDLDIVLQIGSLSEDDLEAARDNVARYTVGV